MKILIIEDEPGTARRLQKMLGEISPKYAIEDILDSVEDSIAWLRENNEPDLIFMDIHLADGNSFEIFKSVDLSCPVIFTTAYDQYAIKAFKVNSIDYLLKPIKKEELENSLKKFQNTISKNEKVLFDIEKVREMFKHESKPELKRLIVKIGPKIIAVNINNIAYFQIVNKAVYAVIFKGNLYPVDFTLEQLEEELNKTQFFRINRSFIISIEAIKSMHAYSKSRIKIELNPNCKEEVITSTERSGSFKEWLKGK